MFNMSLSSSSLSRNVQERYGCGQNVCFQLTNFWSLKLYFCWFIFVPLINSADGSKSKQNVFKVFIEKPQCHWILANIYLQWRSNALVCNRVVTTSLWLQKHLKDHQWKQEATEPLSFVAKPVNTDSMHVWFLFVETFFFSTNLQTCKKNKNKHKQKQKQN